MVRLRKLLDAGCEVTFLPGDDSAGDGSRAYEIHMITFEGDGVTAVGPSPQETLLRASRLRPGIGQVTYATSAAGGWFADLRDTTGRSTATGYGRSQAEALAQLRERQAAGDPAEDDDNLEPYCRECGAGIGVFIGHGQGWHHFRGSGTVEAPVELYDAGHEPVVAWRENAPAPAGQ
jgi:hypothetical protein